MLSCSFRPTPLRAVFGLTFLALTSSSFAQAQTAVLTQNNDNSRTGANLAETTLTPANVNTQKFGKLFTSLAPKGALL